MSIRTVDGLIGATNAAKDLQGMAANFFINFQAHANGVNGVKVPSEPFVVVPVAVEGTADRPRLTFALVWTERVTWQVTDYLSPDDDSYSEHWGADNSCGYHTESKDHQREKRLTVDAECLLMPNERQIDMLKKWKTEDDAKKKEQARLSRIAQLNQEIQKLNGQKALT